jgi:carbon storage regulator
MLVLSRKVGEVLVIADNIRVKVISIDRGRVKLAVMAPREVRVDREEVRKVRTQPEGEK